MLLPGAVSLLPQSPVEASMIDAASIRADTIVVAFDIYDTLLDREAALKPALAAVLGDTTHDPGIFLRRYLAMHFRDSLIDALIPGPHTPFKVITARALRYRLDQANVKYTQSDITGVIEKWTDLQPYEDVDAALARIGEEYDLVGLSNGDPDMLRAVQPNFEVDLDDMVSVARAGAYKPHPAPYRRLLDRHDVAPHEVLFVSAHTFDIVGAAAIGLRSAYLNRHGNPFGDWPQQPDITIETASDLADALCSP